MTVELAQNKIYMCPKCRCVDDIAVERRPYGDAFCGKCKHKSPALEFLLSVFIEKKEEKKMSPDILYKIEYWESGGHNNVAWVISSSLESALEKFKRNTMSEGPQPARQVTAINPAGGWLLT